MVLLEVQNLIKDYYLPGSKEKIPVLRGINLTIEKGQFIAIMGPSGSGKSTLLNILSSLDSPTAGSIVIDGQVLDSKTTKKKKVHLRRSMTSIVFQSFNLIEQLTALENVCMPLTIAGLQLDEAKEKASFALKQMRLEHRLNHLPEDLSGGERQRVAIARALVTKPKIILADEPTGNLDSKTGLEMIQIFKELKNQDITTLMVTHDPNLAHQADKIFILRNGKLVTEENGS